MTYIDVVDKILDSNDVTVGGGSTSAIVGAFAAGLLSMVAKLSLKKDYGLPADKHLEIAKELDVLNKELLQGAQEDVKAYLMIKNAYILPKVTDYDKEIRKIAIGNAEIEAANVPRDNAYRCLRVYKLGQIMDGKFNTATTSDFSMGMALAKLGVKGCVWNIEANLSLISDKAKIKEFEQNIEELKKHLEGVLK